ncbi:MAG: hypothetical protein WCD57_22280, partial [Acidobacteriaceae bacterium]
VVEELKRGGLQAKEDKIKSNVSAVLSRMVANGEVSNTGSTGYEITERGRGALTAIRVASIRNAKRPAPTLDPSIFEEEDSPTEKYQ